MLTCIAELEIHPVAPAVAWSKGGRAEAMMRIVDIVQIVSSLETLSTLRLQVTGYRHQQSSAKCRTRRLQ
jgi:3'-phosphoadenosine 5'-phosphosulfate sulfotransferase (PAPS reductase)/FAD synthetase